MLETMKFVWITFFLHSTLMLRSPYAMPSNTQRLACGHNFRFHQGACYHISHYFDVWDNAQDYCRYLGGEIAADDAVIRQDMKSLISPLIWVSGPPPNAYDDGWRCSVWNKTRAKIVRMDCDSRFTTVCKRHLWVFNGECPEGFLGAGDKCFRVFASVGDRVKPIEAKKRCEKYYGGTVAEVSNQAELSALISMMEGRAAVDVFFTLSNGFWSALSKSKPFLQLKQKGNIRLLGDKSVLPGTLAHASPADSFGYVCTAKRLRKRLKRRDELSFSGDWTQGNCDKGFVSFQSLSNFCLRMPASHERKTWVQAQDFCRNKDASLVSIRTESEQANVHLVRLMNDANLWLGVNGSSWSDGSQSGFVNWRSSEPRTCGSMAWDGEWESTNCSQELPFICTKRKRTPFSVIDASRKCIDVFPDLIQFKRFCYQIFPTILPFADAVRRCCDTFRFKHLPIGDQQKVDQYRDRRCLGNLMEVESKLELAFILQEVQSFFSEKHPALHSMWVGNARNVTYNGWTASSGSGINKCTMSSLTGEWQNVPCNQRLPFVCKIPTMKVRSRPPTPLSDGRSVSVDTIIAICVSFGVAAVIIVGLIIFFMYKKLSTKVATSIIYDRPPAPDEATAPKTMSQLLQNPSDERNSGVMEDVYEEMEDRDILAE